LPANPALLRHAQQRRQNWENRIADRITQFSGSMRFIYLHVIWFGSWIGFRVEPYPFGLLTMIAGEAGHRAGSGGGAVHRSPPGRRAVHGCRWPDRVAGRA